MSYTPTEWANGDIITAEKLNKMENGIAAAENLVATISFDEDTGRVTLDKTWKEIHDAIVAGRTCMTVEIQDENSAGQSAIILASKSGSDYTVQAGDNIFTTDSENGYPGYED